MLLLNTLGSATEHGLIVDLGPSLDEASLRGEESGLRRGKAQPTLGEILQVLLENFHDSSFKVLSLLIN
jgi:hypothetical protein